MPFFLRNLRGSAKSAAELRWLGPFDVAQGRVREGARPHTCTASVFLRVLVIFVLEFCPDGLAFREAGGTERG
jgi:hypothetical protein